MSADSEAIMPALSSVSSPTIGALAAALSLAQAEIEGAVKDRTNPAFRTSYADLASVWEACRAPLTRNGLSVIQLPEDDGAGRVALRTVLAHKSGEFVSARVSAPLVKADAQAVGSALTYLRRYSLAAMVGVAPEDDDGNAASDRGERPARSTTPRERPAPASTTPPASGDQHDPSWARDRAGFCAALTGLGLSYDEVAAWRSALGKPRPSALTSENRRRFLDWIKTDDAAASFGLWKEEQAKATTTKEKS